MYGQYKRGGMVSAQRGFGGQPLQQMQFQQQNPPNVGMAVDAIVSGFNQQQQPSNAPANKKPASALILEYQQLLQKKKGNDSSVNNNKHNRNRGSGGGNGSGILRSSIAPLQASPQKAPMSMNMNSNYINSNFMSDMYSRPSDSESSAEDDEDDNGNDDENGRLVSLSHSTSFVQHRMQNNPLLPEIPNMSALVPDIDIKPEQQQLVMHCGFVTKLNARLVELNARTRLKYPRLASDLVESECRNLFHKEYLRTMEQFVKQQKKSEELEQQVQILLPVQELNNNLMEENDKLRRSNMTMLSSKKSSQAEMDYRQMVSQTSREYVIEIEKQLNIYRDKVIFLSQQSQSFVGTLKNSVSTLTKAQEDINDAHLEIKALGDHITYLEEQQQDTIEVDRLRQQLQKSGLDFKEKEEQLIFQIQKSTNEAMNLQQEVNYLKSEQFANVQQLEEHAAYQSRQQIQQLEERLSKMTISRMTMEDEFVKRHKSEQERADKYRAKYESVKQHVKTLELQKSEYTKVNMQLRQQNNQFRTMITQLQQNLKKATEMNKKNQQLLKEKNNNQSVASSSNLSMMPSMIPNVNMSGLMPNNTNFQLQSLMEQQRQLQKQMEMRKMQNFNFNVQQANNVSAQDNAIFLQKQMNQMQMQGMNNAFGGMGSGGVVLGGQKNGGGVNMDSNAPNLQSGSSNSNLMMHKYANQNVNYAGQPQNQNQGLRQGQSEQKSKPPPPPNNNNQQPMPANSNVIDMSNRNNYNNNGMLRNSTVDQYERIEVADVSNPIVGYDHQNKEIRMNDLWGKRTKLISSKGNKKRILVEWHFVTSDKQPHTVVLQHTQDNKPKTRRMLWVDGSEKYNNKSSASSFRIEIDTDVVVVSVDLHDGQYQYRLNINTLNYQEAFQGWKALGCPI